MAWQVLPSHGAHATLVGARHRQPWALVLVTLRPQRQSGAVSGPTPCSWPRGPLRGSGRASPGWCRRRTPWCSRCKAGCAWGTRRWHAGPAAAASCGHHTCSHSTRSLAGTHPRGSAESAGVGWGAEPSGLLGPPGAPPPPRGPTHLEGLPAEVAAAELALEPPLGAVVLQVRRQVAAAQLGGAAVGAGHHVEAAGIQVALVGGVELAPAGVGGWGLSCHPGQRLTCRCRRGPFQRQPSSLWMQRMDRPNTCTSSSGSG